MKTQKAHDLVVAQHVQERLTIIGQVLKVYVKERSTIRKLAYESWISETQIFKYYKGEDMYLSSFLKLLYGLELTGEEFFRTVEL